MDQGSDGAARCRAPLMTFANVPVLWFVDVHGCLLICPVSLQTFLCRPSDALVIVSHWPRLLECFQHAAQRSRNAKLDDSLPVISLEALTLRCHSTGVPGSPGFSRLIPLLCRFAIAKKTFEPRKTFDGLQIPMTYCCVKGRVLVEKMIRRHAKTCC